MNESNWKWIMRKVKNTPPASNAERVLMENDYDQGSLWRRSAIIEKIVLGGAGSQILNTPLPAGATVLAVGIFLETGVALTTATKLAVGTAALPSAFFLSGTAMTAGTTAIVGAPAANAIVSASTPIQLTTTDNSGAPAGTGVGTVKVVVIYEYAQPITA